MTLSEIIRQSQEKPYVLPEEGVEERIARILSRERIGIEEFCALLSHNSPVLLERMAQKAAALTRRHFGNTIQIFTPMYISNFCENRCPYCSFSSSQRIERRQLDAEQIRAETRRIAQSGIRHILVLTGEARGKTDIDYVAKSVGVIAQSFSSIGIEMYPMEEDEYRRLVDSGVDSLTIYQEVYNEDAYHRYHAGGPKENYRFRLEAADRACRAGVRSVTIGALLGLGDTMREMHSLALHAQYLQDTYPDVDVLLSFPRIRPLVSDFPIPYPASERRLVQIITAFRILFPHIGITLSTRESKKFRDGAVRLGVTKMSAGVSTAVAGHSESSSVGQFEIADTRSVEQVCADLIKLGFQPVMHNWNTKLVADVSCFK